MSSIVIKGDTSGQIEIAAPAVAGSTTLTLPTGSGNIIKDDGSGNLSVSGAITGTGGIYLGGTASANLLDDYEEGTWTPEITNPTDDVTATYTWREGYYRKIGSLVWVFAGIQLATYSYSTGTNSAEISGLPFTVDDLLTGSSVDGGGYVPYFGNLATSWIYISASGIGNTTKLRMWGATGAVTVLNQIRSLDFGGSTSLRVNAIYITS